MVISVDLLRTELEAIFMERAVIIEDLKCRIEQLELERENLIAKEKRQESHMELLVKENLDLQHKGNTANSFNLLVYKMGFLYTHILGQSEHEFVILFA